MRKRIFAAFVCLCMLMALVPSMAYANDTVYTGGLCEHHTQHDDACGYSEGTAEIPCSHEHNESCGGLTDPAACNHTHDEACGYVPATEGTPCTFVCEVCNPQDNGNPEALSDAQPEESTCETLCTGEEINADCPVCSAEGAELDKVCVGAALMLPVTALAAAPQTLYVGDYQITNGSAITYLKAGSTAGSLVVGSEDDWTVKYEPSTATLTLNGATIQGGTSTGSVPYGAGIYAQCSNGQSVTLTIKLIGKNTITGYYGIYVNAEISENSNGTDASLTITGENNGSLEVSGSFYGIFVKSGTGNASLTINDASVVAKTTQTNSGYAGVCVQSSANATGSPNISLSVDGGSLTASGGTSGDGIQFVVGSHGVTGDTTSLSVTNNAIVDARNGGISASRISETLPTPTPTGNNSSGIVFDDKNGTVYGNVTLQEDLEIGEGESLTIGKDASLTVPGGTTLTNNGTIVNTGGALNGEPSGTGRIETTPTITVQPTSQTVTEGETATFTVKANGTEPLSYQWQQGTDKGSSWTNIDSATSDTYTTGKTTMDMNGTQYRCVVENIVKKVTSDAATLTVTAIPTYTITVQTDGHGTASASSTTATAGKQITLTATSNSGYRFARWEVVLGDITITNNTFTMPAKNVTIKAIFNRKSSGGSVFFWDLKFDTNGGSDIDTVTEWEYSTIDLDEYVPEKEGYKFVGWYADKDLDKKIDEVYLTEDTTVYAKWEKIEEEVPEEPDETEEIKETETISFKDVKENDWFYEAVSYAVENGLMNGMSEDIFAPNTPLTREMLAVVLYNVEGQPESTGVNPFTDVKADIWYTDAILWANENGIVAGYDNGAYGVGDLITREQFATILYRYAQFKGYDTTQGGMAVREFSDYENISDYARPAMAWAVNAGIMGGMDDGTLMPQGKATRAEAATMLMNFCENMVEK
ncbi:MAG: S-layer homology domain-containing protein [Anaerotignum lactatifermentans]|uniref:S-layer homology domain-containing protein n=1 Tax=Anaerotignum lactatifermentans TaxID=160404 RepID=UPI003999A14C